MVVGGGRRRGRERLKRRSQRLLLGPSCGRSSTPCLKATLAAPLSVRPAHGTLALEGHARFLSHDLPEGRHPASRGEHIAANYLISGLRALGLDPLPSAAYRLPVPLTAADVDMDRVRLHLSGDGGDRTVRPPAFYHPGGGRVAFRDFAGPLLFAGAASGALDALDGRDLTGAVVVITPPWSGLTEVEEELIRRGAAGSIPLVPDGTFYERLRIVRGPTRYFLPDDVEDPANQSQLPRVTGGPELIAALGLRTRRRRTTRSRLRVPWGSRPRWSCPTRPRSAAGR